MPKTIKLFDPAMCCTTGVCGPTIDPTLARVSADLDWLAGHGITVERFNLAQQPGPFASSAIVKSALEAQGEAALPIIFVDDNPVMLGVYPTRQQLATWFGIEEAAADAPAPTNTGCCGGSSKQESKGCC